MAVIETLEHGQPARAVDIPLVIDLDGTLLRSDLLMETGLLFLRDQPARCLAPARWLMRGKAALKHELAGATKLDVTVLPYDPQVIAFIEKERATGRRIVLATASHHQLSKQVAEHLGLFDEVMASDLGRNLSGPTKRDALVEAFGEKGFDYAGNSRDDLPVWSSARQAHVVSAPASVERKAQTHGNVAQVLGASPATLRDWTKALRLHQWLKNALIFVPLLAAHRHIDLSLLASVLLAFACFSLCASSVYILNDLLDLQDDRHHSRKKARPFASGRLSILSGLIAFPALLLTSVALAAWQLPLAFLAVLGVYYVLTLSYSLSLKRRMVIDVMTLAGLYTLRIVAGAFALDIPLSFWLLAFSMFMFLSLALVKRFAELFQVRAQGRERARGRGYYPNDLPMISALGAASGYMAVMVMALYINDVHTTQLYRRPEIIWFACPLLLTWITRVWMLTHRGRMNEDPVVFAARDRVSLTIVALVGLVFWAAI